MRLLVVLATSGDANADWLAAGQALAAVLLRAAKEGISASYLNQPLEVPELRPQVASMLNIEGHAQATLRLGYCELVKLTPRRPVDEVLRT